MPTVIDSLVVELGLDPKKLTQGQREAIESIRRTKVEARESAKGIEEAFDRTGQVISRVQTRVLGLMALFVGGRGMKDFIGDIVKTNAETGRTAPLINMATTALSTWRGVAALTGGTAAGITSSIAGLVQQFEHFSLTGEASGAIPYFRALNVDIANVNTGKMRAMRDIMLDLADRFSKLDPSKAAAFGRAFGFDDATISLLIRGRAAVEGLYKEAEKLGTVSKEDAAAASELEKAWNAVTLSVTDAGRSFVTQLTPSMLSALTRMKELTTFVTENLIKNKSLPAWAKSFLSLFAPPTDIDLQGRASVPTVAVRPAPGDQSSLRVKPGAGSTSLATAALARTLQSEVPGLDRFTSFNDAYHALLGGGAHGRGQALDFTLKDPSQSAAIAAQVRKKLADMGIDAKVLDEYANPSRGSTGGHLHVQFNSAEAAQRFYDLAGGAVGAAATQNVQNRSSTSSNQVSIGKIEVNTQATDSDGIARDIKPAIERNTFSQQANYGPN